MGFRKELDGRVIKLLTLSESMLLSKYEDRPSQQFILNSIAAVDNTN